MKYSQIFIAGLVLVFSLIFVLSSFSETKILLKNGMSFTADGCQEADGKLRCYITGGLFEFDKDEIENLKEITIERSTSEEVPGEKTGQDAAIKGKEQVKPEADGKVTEKQPEGLSVNGLKPEEEKRLDQINKRKMDLIREREKLNREREQLNKDIKEFGIGYTYEQSVAINKRTADIEERISRFNEEVKKLVEEEDKIMRGQGEKQ